MFKEIKEDIFKMDIKLGNLNGKIEFLKKELKGYFRFEKSIIFEIFKSLISLVVVWRKEWVNLKLD